MVGRNAIFSEEFSRKKIKEKEFVGLGIDGRVIISSS